jgi:hypothetical protein
MWRPLNLSTWVITKGDSSVCFPLNFLTKIHRGFGLGVILGEKDTIRKVELSSQGTPNKNQTEEKSQTEDLKREEFLGMAILHQSTSFVCFLVFRCACKKYIFVGRVRRRC